MSRDGLPGRKHRSRSFLDWLKIRNEKDLLEVAFGFSGSVSFDPAATPKPILILTKSGKQFNGLIRRETPDEITLATGAKEEARIARSDIEEIRPSSISIMPAGLDTQLTKQQIADLITYLPQIKAMIGY